MEQKRAYTSGVSPNLCVIIDDGRKADYRVSSFSPNISKSQQAQNYLERGLSPGGVNVFNSYACSSCQACLQTRINLKRFTLKDAQRKLYTDNADLTVSFHRGMGSLGANKGQNSYMNVIFHYAASKNKAHPKNAYLRYTALDEFRGMDVWHADARNRNAHLAAFIIFFQTGRDVSFYEHFYEPQRLGMPGRFTIVKALEMLKESGEFDFVYLGPWNPLSDRMNWKLHIPGLEFFIDGQWHALDSSQKWHLRQNLSAQFRHVP